MDRLEPAPPGPTPAVSSQHVLLCQCFVALVALYWTAAIALAPYELLALNNGHGWQLAGGAEILAGRHPFLDFRDCYGPLAFYASASAQAFSGGGLFGELLLNCAAPALAFALWFRLLTTVDVPARIALPLTLSAVVAMPVPYRYYLVLLPVFFFWAAWRYTEGASLRRLALLALGATVTGLFRPDFGVYVCLAGIVLLALHSPVARRSRIRAIACFLGLVLAWALPWLGWLAAHGQLVDYLMLSSIDAMHKASGYTREMPTLSLAHELFAPSNLKAVFFRLPQCACVLGAIVFFLRWRQLAAVVRARLACVLAFAALSLLQTSHLVDWMHVRDVVPMSTFLLAWVIAQAGPAEAPAPWQRRCFQLAAGCSAVVALGFAAGAVHKETRHAFAPLAVARKAASYRGSLDELLARLRAGPDPYRALAVVDLVRTQSPPHAPLLVLVEGPQLNYFCSRPLAGGQFALLPGYLDREVRQREFVARLRAQPPAYVIINRRVMEEHPDLPLEKFAPIAAEHIEQTFGRVRAFGPFSVLAARTVPYQRPAPR